MATSKLTLSVDRDTIKMAKKFAAESNTSVSKLFKALLINEIVSNRKKNDPILEKIRNTGIPDWVKQLTLPDKPSPDLDHKAEYGEHLEEKYGV